MQPDNVLMGDMGLSIPPVGSGVDEQDLVKEKKMAEFTKSAEFKKIQEHCQRRIEFYQQYFPNGQPVATASKKDREDMWAVANLVINELNELMNMYQTAAEAVETAASDD